MKVFTYLPSQDFHSLMATGVFEPPQDSIKGFVHPYWSIGINLTADSLLNNQLLLNNCVIDGCDSIPQFLEKHYLLELDIPMSGIFGSSQVLSNVTIVRIKKEHLVGIYKVSASDTDLTIKVVEVLKRKALFRNYVLVTLAPSSDSLTLSVSDTFEEDYQQLMFHLNECVIDSKFRHLVKERILWSGINSEEVSHLANFLTARCEAAFEVASEIVREAMETPLTT